MARFCNQCGRDLAEHPRKPMLTQYVEELDWDFTWGPLIRVCDVRLIAGRPGSEFVPTGDNPWQREGRHGARYVHVSRLQPKLVA